jgi:hypothetical protein
MPPGSTEKQADAGSSGKRTALCRRRAGRARIRETGYAGLTGGVVALADSQWASPMRRHALEIRRSLHAERCYLPPAALRPSGNPRNIPDRTRTCYLRLRGRIAICVKPIGTWGLRQGALFRQRPKRPKPYTVAGLGRCQESATNRQCVALCGGLATNRLHPKDLLTANAYKSCVVAVLRESAPFPSS